MATKLPQLPVDLNELPDREVLSPAPIGGKLSTFIPRKHLEADMAKVIADIKTVGSRVPPLPANIERITEELNSLMTASAEAMLTEAQNLANETKAWADNLTQEIAKKIAEHATLAERIQAFGKDVLAAHNKYHGE